MSRWYEQSAVNYPLSHNSEVCQPDVIIRLDDIESFSPWDGGTMCRMASGHMLFIAGDHQKNTRMIVHGEQPR
jgi:hypothetical protein